MDVRVPVGSHPAHEIELELDEPAEWLRHELAVVRQRRAWRSTSAWTSRGPRRGGGVDRRVRARLTGGMRSRSMALPSASPSPFSLAGSQRHPAPAKNTRAIAMSMEERILGSLRETAGESIFRMDHRTQRASYSIKPSIPPEVSPAQVGSTLCKSSGSGSAFLVSLRPGGAWPPRSGRRPGRRRQGARGDVSERENRRANKAYHTLREQPILETAAAKHDRFQPGELARYADYPPPVRCESRPPGSWAVPQPSRRLVSATHGRQSRRWSMPPPASECSPIATSKPPVPTSRPCPRAAWPPRPRTRNGGPGPGAPPRRRTAGPRSLSPWRPVVIAGPSSSRLCSAVE